MRKSTKKARSKKPSQRSKSEHPNPDDYQMVLLWSEEDGCYVVTLPGWQNARTHGATLEEATRVDLAVLEPAAFEVVLMPPRHWDIPH